jgi:four helix bundle protein
MAFVKAEKLVLEVYTVTRSFPRDEQFGLTSQLRRSAVSVPDRVKRTSSDLLI